MINPVSTQRKISDFSNPAQAEYEKFSAWLKTKTNYLFSGESIPEQYPNPERLFRIYDLNKKIIYVTPSGELVKKVGTKIIPVLYHVLSIITPETRSCYKFTIDGKIRSFPGHFPKVSRPGIPILTTAGVQGYLFAWETEWQRKGDIFNNHTGRYEAKKGWVSGQAYGENRYLEIRKFGSDKGYTILEEYGRQQVRIC